MALPQIPEIICQIATELDDILDVSSLSRCDRFTNGAVTPVLFRHIAIPARCLPQLAQRFMATPEVASMCRSLEIVYLQLGSDRRLKQPNLLDDSYNHPCDVISQAMSTILLEIAKHGRLERFDCLDARVLSFVLNPRCWTALSSLGCNLKELSIAVFESELQDFEIFVESSTLPRLQTLRLNLSSSDTTCIVKFVSQLLALQHLHLECLSPHYLAFVTYHPLLRTLFLDTNSRAPALPPDFLARHPTIERLYLDSCPVFCCDDTSLPNLKALAIGQQSVEGLAFLFGSFATARREIKHLRLNQMPSLNLPVTQNILRVTGSSLTCLEIDCCTIEEYRRLESQHIQQLPNLAPGLLELALFARSPQLPLVLTWTAKDLTHALAVLDQPWRLQVLRFYDLGKSGSVLPDSLLHNLGAVPPALRYIYWDVHPDPKMYSLERIGGINSAVAMSDPLPQKANVDWTCDSILDHLS
ncbi:hypothetical protein R3P38DRAFT_1155412 [Favolaschia claudopus]|uniref:F-box domain-containing protein n=1 Tax=Favolaschia claudopus TaxID=2862362 RepID=A0AAW0B6G5_9AGAR